MLDRLVVIAYNNINRIINEVGIPTGEIPGKKLTIEEVVGLHLTTIMLGINTISAEIAKFRNLVEVSYYANKQQIIPNSSIEGVFDRTREAIFSLKNEIIHRMHLQLAEFDNNYLKVSVASENDSAIELLSKIRDVVTEYFDSEETMMNSEIKRYF